MSATVLHRAEQPTVGARTELATYTLPTGSRVIYGQRIRGHVRLVDAPDSSPGRSWIIETNLEQDGNAAMLALIDDYIRQATRHQCVPAAPAGVASFIHALEELDLDAPTDQALPLAA